MDAIHEFNEKVRRSLYKLQSSLEMEGVDAFVGRIVVWPRHATTNMKSGVITGVRWAHERDRGVTFVVTGSGWDNRPDELDVYADECQLVETKRDEELGDLLCRWEGLLRKDRLQKLQDVGILDACGHLCLGILPVEL